MERAILTRTIVLGTLVCALASHAQEPMGPEQQVNTYTSNDQRSPQVATMSDGKIVVAWRSDGSTGTDSQGVSAQYRRFTTAGVPFGPELQANEQTPHYQWPTRLLPMDDGDWTLVWGTSISSPDSPYGSGSARRFAADGIPLTSEFVVADVSAYAGAPAAAGRASGAFVVARTLDYDEIEVSRFSAGGSGIGSLLLTRAGHALSSPGVSMAPGGEFVVAWRDESGTYSAYASDIRFRRFHPTGAPAGEAVDVTGPDSEGLRYATRLARRADGAFLVVWVEESSEDADDSGSSIQGRLYGPTGIPLGERFQVNDRTPGDQLEPEAAAAPDGTFAVAWTDDSGEVPGAGDGSESGIRARQLGQNGTPNSSSFAVNALTIGSQTGPSIAVDSSGNFLIAWTSAGSLGGDSSGTSVQLRKFRPALFADGFESGDTSRWTDGSGEG